MQRKIVWVCETHRALCRSAKLFPGYCAFVILKSSEDKVIKHSKYDYYVGRNWREKIQALAPQKL